MKLKAFLMVCMGISMPLSAWAADGRLLGRVTGGGKDVPIADAHIVLSGGGHTFVTTSDADGRYELTGIDTAATYTILVDVKGMRPFTQGEISVRDDEASRLDAHLLLRDVRTEVIVTQGLINLEAAGSETSQTIGAEEVKELPSVSRSAAKYALLDPHVRQTLGLGADYQDANRLSINAGSYRHTSYTLDDTINYDWVYAVTPQANVAAASVDEVKVLSGTYSAQYGSSSTGVIAITTSSGTDLHHGNYFAYIRPSGIQANPALATFHIPNQKLDWGASQGGPLIKNRTYYFVSYERTQQDRGALITSPTLGFFDGRSNQYSGLLKLDHHLNEKNVLSMRWNGDHYATNNANDRVAGINNPSYGRTARVQSWGGQISDQAQIGNIINVARFTYTNYTPDSATPLVASPGVVVPNYLQQGYSTYSWVHAQSETVSDLVALRHGPHNLKLGAEFTNLQVKDYSYAPYGTYSFRTAADFAALNAYTYTQTYGAADLHYGQKAFSAFAQDDIRLTPRLTVSAGVRFEFQSITNASRNFGPRIGVAWDIAGDGKTVLRFGGGVFFDQYYMYVTRRFITAGPSSPQFNYTWDCTAVPNPCPIYPNAIATPTGGTQAPFVSYLYIPGDKLVNPYSLQINASIEHRLTRNTTLALSALNAHTLKQMRVNDINHPMPFLRTAAGQVRSVAAANATRPFTSYAGVNKVTLVDRIENSASSIYQSIDASLKTQFTRWSEINAHYVFSGSYTYAMFYADYNSGVPSEWYPNWDRFERGPSDFYQRHRFIADTILHGPYKTMLSLVGNFGSGLPVNPITGVDNNGDGYSVDRPVGLGRNSFRTLSQKTLDMAISKQFAVRDRMSIEARAEGLNILNSRNFITVNNIYGNAVQPLGSFLAPLAGVSNTDPSRQWQGVARVRF